MKILDRYRLDYALDVKSLPSQSSEEREESTGHPTHYQGFHTAYNNIEAVRRGVDLIVDLSSEMDFDIRDRNDQGNVAKIPRQKLLNRALNIYPSKTKILAYFVETSTLI